ncbi:MAG: hypothetical protein QM715_11535 [Nibricoccus sp.]
MPIPSIARLLALVAGALDLCTGLGLVFFPRLVLPLMRVATPEGEALVYLRFVGAFVGAVGACYLWALVRGGPDRLRLTLELTILFRISAGAFSGTAIALGWLSFAWISVPATDFALVGFQLWLVKKLAASNASAVNSSSV